MILFYDTETTGMIKDWSQQVDGSSNFPNIVQLGWALFTHDGKLIASSCTLIKPKGWIIEPQAQQVHGKTLEMCEVDGIHIHEALKPFVIFHHASDLVVAHNHNFDSKIVCAELIRLKSKYTHEKFKAKPSFCTMMKTTSFCQLPKTNGRGGYKWPQLKELHEKLFRQPMGDSHDAMVDVLATAKCFFECVKRGIIEI